MTAFLGSMTPQISNVDDGDRSYDRRVAEELLLKEAAIRSAEVDVPDALLDRYRRAVHRILAVARFVRDPARASRDYDMSVLEADIAAQHRCDPPSLTEEPLLDGIDGKLVEETLRIYEGIARLAAQRKGSEQLLDAVLALLNFIELIRLERWSECALPSANACRGELREYWKAIPEVFPDLIAHLQSAPHPEYVESFEQFYDYLISHTRLGELEKARSDAIQIVEKLTDCAPRIICAGIVRMYGAAVDAEEFDLAFVHADTLNGRNAMTGERAPEGAFTTFSYPDIMIDAVKSFAHRMQTGEVCGDSGGADASFRRLLDRVRASMDRRFGTERSQKFIEEVRGWLLWERTPPNDAVTGYWLGQAKRYLEALATAKADENEAPTASPRAPADPESSGTAGRCP